MKLKKKIKKSYEGASKFTIAVYLFLRTLVFLAFIRELFLKEYGNAILCLITLVLFIVPFFIEKKYKIKLPSLLEVIILLFIFTGVILGEIHNMYVRVDNIDTIMHTLNGFLCAAVGFSLVDLLNENVKRINLSPFFVTIVAFCFSMTIGIIWEFYEFGCDRIFKTDMQKDTFLKSIATVELDEQKINKSIVIKDIDKVILYDKENRELATFNGYLDIGIIDTMKDLLVNFIGSLVFSIFGYLYIRNRDKYKFVDNFIVTKEIPKKID